MKLFSYILPFLLPTFLFGDHEKLLPATTPAVFSISDYKMWREHFPNTGLGKFMTSDITNGLRNGLSEELESRPALKEFLDSKIIRKYCDGQLTVCAIPVGTRMELCLYVQCKDGAQANTCQQEIDEIFGAQVETNRIDNTVLFSSSTPAIKNITSSSKALANDQRFIKTTALAINEGNDSLFWFFFDAIQLGEFRRSNRDDSAKSLDWLGDEGFNAVKAIGGCGTLKTKNDPTNFVAYIDVEKPFTKGMRLFDLANSKELLANHLFENALSRGKLGIDWKKSLTNVETVFDRLVGGGEEGVFELVIEDLKTADDGPKIDLQKEFVELLNGPLLFGQVLVKDQPQTVIAVSANSDKEVANTVSRFYADDPNAKSLQDAGFPAWLISPIGNDSGIKNYTVAVHSNHFWVASSIDAIKRAVEKSQTKQQSIDSTIEKACFCYELNFESVSGLRVNQLRNGKMHGLLGRLLKELELESALENADTSKWPSNKEVANYFASWLRIVGENRRNGFRIEGSIE